jgi:multisubunit Na+/H+ antiporter MnhB subunit
VVVTGVCAAMLLVGLVLAARWRDRPFQPPPPVDAPSVAEVARRYVWYCSLLLLGGIGTGILVLGAGGRLAMRLLAVTAGDSAQGRITEADEVVGEITVDGTVGFIVFNGIVGGVVAAGIYLVLRRVGRRTPTSTSSVRDGCPYWCSPPWPWPSGWRWPLAWRG